MFMQVLVKAKNYSRAHVFSRSSGLKPMARSIGSRNHPAIARQVMRNPKTKAMCLKVLEKEIQRDMSRVASMRKGSSSLREKNLNGLQSFS